MDTFNTSQIAFAAASSLLSARPGESNPNGGTGHLTWLNVIIGLAFVAFDAILSISLGLGIGSSLIVAALRCVLQLSVMALILDKVFAANNIFGVLGIALLLNVLGATEATFNKSKRRFANMFPLILLSMLCGTTPVTIVGTRFAMAQKPFWQPDQYVPIVGMILGNAISAIGVGINSIQKEFVENRDKIETYLAMGASRFEACKPIGVEALKLAMLPTVNQMSVIGLISIPGMMTGAIIGGQSVEQAARLQMIIMFMISASSALCVFFAMFFALSTLIDAQHRIRLDRLDSRAPAFYRWRDASARKVWSRCKAGGRAVGGILGLRKNDGSEGERARLLNGDADRNGDE